MDKILAIDDNENNLISISAQLNVLIPHSVVITAKSGREGLEKARIEQPDVILLDIHMPGMDGFEVCERLKAEETTRRIPVLMLTAVRKDSASCVKGLESGADAFLTKPINESELAAQINVALRIRKAEEKLETQNEILTAQLQKALKMEAMGTLAGGIAHDFNNILSVIIGEAQLMEYDIPQDSHLRANLDELLAAAFRATELVNQILLFCRDTEQTQKPVMLSLIVKEAVKFLRASLPSTIEIRHAIETRGTTVFADSSQMHQIVMNLCANAGYVTRDKGGLLEIKLQKIDFGEPLTGPFDTPLSGPYILLSVRDNGEGMAPEIIERIFDPYFTTKPEGAGTGMGLSVVHGAVKNHGGEIHVSSQPGQGSVFEVYLPRWDGNDPAHQNEAPEDAVFYGDERILMVDDERPNVNVGKRLLNSLGYEVAGLTDPVEALDYFRIHSGQVDLAILDMTMPKMTGDQLAVRMLEIRPDIPIILCTGFSERISRKEALKVGIAEYLPKPVKKQTLSKAVRKTLDRYKELYGEGADHRR